MKFLTKELQDLCKESLERKNINYNVWAAILRIGEEIDKLRIKKEGD